MLRDIQREGWPAGMLFEWADEWFKFTWNTMDSSSRRRAAPLWRNDLTNEEHFGLIAAETRGQRPSGGTQIAGPGSGLQLLRASHDEEYLTCGCVSTAPGVAAPSA